jgi:hypothetical protein
MKMEKNFDVFEGKWQSYTNDSSFILEEWNKTSDTFFEAKTTFVTPTNSKVLEEIELYENEHGVFFSPLVFNQNDSNRVSFQCKKNANNLFVFENKKHDFPQRIQYHFLNDSILRAEISGMIDDKELKDSFMFKKIK